MRDRNPRDEISYARPDDRPREMVVDLFDSDRMTDRADASIQRVGGRRRVRPELLLAVLAPLFIVAALLKPWSAIPSPVNDGPSSTAMPSGAEVAPATSTPAALAEAPSPSEQPSPVGWPDIPPGDYRFPQEALPPLDATTGAAAVPARGWPAVDWTLLYVVDQHDAWGFGTAIVPDQTDAPAGIPTTTPALGWVPAAVQPGSTVVTVDAGTGIYAIDVTWPASVRATGVRFTYLQDPAFPASMTPAGFLPASEVSPLSATVVAYAGVASPFGAPVTPPSVGPVRTDDGSLRSGQFWIAPSGASPLISPAAPADAIPATWHSAPWKWPAGEYRVTIDTTTGVVALLLVIEQAT